MQIRSPRLRPWVREMLPAAGGLTLGVPAGLLGVRNAPQIASYVVRSALNQQIVTPQTALRWLPYLNDSQWMARACGLGFGLTFFAIGCALLLPDHNTSPINKG